MEKAFDHVNWNFLVSVLRGMSFGDKCYNWIKVCISSPSFVVLVNGLSEGFFKSSRGLRQGDPLCPLLFILVSEALSLLISRAVECGFLEGCRVGNNGPPISLLQFVDDSFSLLRPRRGMFKL